jgi:ADP-ribose pyrophosphatase
MSEELTTEFEGRFLRMVRRGKWEYVERRNVTDIAGIVTVTGGKDAVFVEQYRIPVQASTIEWPAGLIGDHGDGESMEEGANRELEEETGYRAESFELLARFPSSAGMTSETVSLLLAKGIEKVSEGGGTPGEGIVVHHVPLRGVDAWLRLREEEGKLVDPKIWGGLYFLLRRGEL